MRKHRSLFMGIGIGLMLGASMLELMNAAGAQSTSFISGPLTKDELRQAAEEQGFALYTKEEMNRKIDEAIAALPDETEPTVTSTTEPSPSASPNAKAEPSPSAEKETADADKIYSIYVEYGDNLKIVADKLKKAGLIVDTAAFIRKAYPISKKLEVGTSFFKGKPTPKQMMDELTRVKSQ